MDAVIKGHTRDLCSNGIVLYLHSGVGHLIAHVIQLHRTKCRHTGMDGGDGGTA